MLKNVLNQHINLGRIILILLFAGGLVFAGTYNGFVVETEAEASCCCGGTDALLAEGPAVPPINLPGIEEINNTPAGQSKANTASGCGCNYSGCSSVKKCSNGCSDVPGCEDTCKCGKTRCSGTHCSSYGHCGKKVKPRGCDLSAPSY